MDFTVILFDGKVADEGTVLLTENKRVDIYGAGRQLIGVRHRSFRPNKILIEKSIVRRAKNDERIKDWIEKDVKGAMDQRGEIVYF